MKTWRLDTPSQTIVLVQRGDSLPFVCYWDSALPIYEDLEQIALSNEGDILGGMLDDLPLTSLSPQISATYQGQLGSIFRGTDGKNVFPRFTEREADVQNNAIKFTCIDPKTGVTLIFDLIAHIESDMFELKTTAKCATPMFIEWLSTPVLPATQNSVETIEITGRWCGEFQHNHHPWSAGSRLRDTASGRTGHESFPGLIIPEVVTTNSNGACFGFHYGWSGGRKMITEQLPDGRRQVQFGHANDAHSELVLEKETASLFVTYSDQGFNGLAKNFQHHARAHVLPFKASERPRPVHYNCWEAVYFNHELGELKEIAERAAALGAERFVLDDGWFGKRDDDHSSLGDWTIDERKFPDGLMPLIDHINGLGMEFGIWFEPEMVNPDSELYRAHPDWALGAPDQLLGRHQMLLNLTLPEVRDYLFNAVNDILSNHPITYVKWDHNRVLPFQLTAQTFGFYELIKRLRDANPEVEFESCASGGGRIDFGVLEHCQRVWLSDSNDAIERFLMQHNAALWLPSDVVGSHVGPRKCHTSGRVLSMSFRAYVAASRHMGFEMDPRELTEEEFATLKDITQWYKDNREWMHAGFTQRLDIADPSQLGEICIAQDKDRFVAFVAQMTPAEAILAKPTRLTGLNPDARYKITLRNPEDAATTSRGKTALSHRSLEMSGKSLMQQGFRLPSAFPATMWVIEGQHLS